ncbi:MAG: hypothetical protein HYZ84_04280 [Candidatus Omnitrophica bacterium]|nr:hypothetical protein [Candidatus Omnitrophota bacterium]
MLIKKLIFVAVTFFLMIFCFEVFSFISLAVLKKSVNPAGLLQKERTRIVSSKPLNPRDILVPSWMRRDVLHPYIGFVLGPPTPQDDLGFQNSISLLQKKSPDKYIVLITGGSVANHLHRYGSKALEAELRKISSIKDRKIIFLRAAIGGFKQPQQLMTLNYLLQLGAEFDLVINLDGFNEVALGKSENIPTNVFLLYPRRWFTRIAQIKLPKLKILMMTAKLLVKTRFDLAKISSLPLIRSSSVCNLIWAAGDHFLQDMTGKTEKAIRGYRPNYFDLTYEITGPSVKFSNNTAIFDYMAQSWARSSLLMAQIASANNIRYFHFLQPNQYFADSKVLTPHERKIAYSDNHLYREGVVMGYPLLKEKGEQWLKSENFYDLTMLFSKESGDIYVDMCCHYNLRGYEILGREMGRIIRNNEAAA